MNNIIDIYNNLIMYDNKKLTYIFDKDNVI